MLVAWETALISSIDQDSDASGLVNADHQHVEFALGVLDFTKGYEIYVFDSGIFYRAGDGGYNNWCTEGEFDLYDDKMEIVYYDCELAITTLQVCADGMSQSSQKRLGFSSQPSRKAS